MKDNNIIQKKSFDFSVRAINAYKYIIAKKKEFVISKEFLKSATSIGANIEEAIGAQSKADFISKLSIAYKEARETSYWVRLMKETDYLNGNESASLLKDLDEIQKIIGKIQVSVKKSVT